jgi:alpha-L-fucosidase
MKSRMIIWIGFMALMGAALVPLLPAAETLPPNPYENETPSQRDARLKWWREARFGMFIHWGVYVVPAGTYQGKQIRGIGEWIMNRGKIPVAEYQAFAKAFNPVKYNPDQWVQLAKEAGVKYIVITSKHHDGFALFDSKATDWDVVHATPYGKDLLQPLAKACAKHGIRLGFYYSQAQDWCHPGGAASGGHWDKAQDGDMDDYLRNIAVPQVKEILSHYGKISVLWWDTPVGMTKERAEMLLPLIRLQPGIIVNNRLGGGYRGDTETPEQYIPATGYPDRDWETCMTMNGTWGYKSYDQDWKPAATLIRNLVDIASKGGNYLLNVGPTSEGLIPEPSVERLRAIGQWMRVNGESIYATTASPFRRLPWGRCTTKLNANGAALYLQVFNWPTDGKLIVPGLRNRINGAYLLADKKKQPLEAADTVGGVTIAVPLAAPDPVCSVVVCRVKGALDIEPVLPMQEADGSLTLLAMEAKIHGQNLQYESGRGKDNLGRWTHPEDWAEWRFRIDQPGRFSVSAETAALDTNRFEIQIGGTRLQGGASKTGDYAKYKSVSLGSLDIPEKGEITLIAKPVIEDWHPMNLKSLRLKPVK